MRFSTNPDQRQLAVLHNKVRANWKKYSRLGLPLYTLTRGSVLLAWMIACFVGFMYLHGTQRLLLRPFVLRSTLPFLALLAFMMPVVQYLTLRRMIGRIGPDLA